MRSPRSPNKARGREFDRHSGTGTRGLPKKNGAGGKGVWGAEIDQQPVTCLDKNDPNYDSDTEPVADAPPTLSLTPPSNGAPVDAAAAPDKTGTAESADSASSGSSAPPTPSPNATD